jgi:hypothetical protein
MEESRQVAKLRAILTYMRRETESETESYLSG